MFRILKLGLAAALALLLPTAAAAQFDVVERLAQSGPPLIIAHRANGGGFPENSLAGIQHAIDTGVGMVRIDIQLTHDGEYVLMHNYSLNATTDVEAVFPDGPPRDAGQGDAGQAEGARKDPVSDYTLAEIQRLHLTGGSDGGIHPVPTLEAALTLMEGRMLAAISIKSYDLERLLAVLAGHPTRNLLVTTTVDPRWVQAVSAATGIGIWGELRGVWTLKPDDLEGLAAAFGPDLLLVSVGKLVPSPEVLATAETLGLRLSAYLGSYDHALLQGDVSAWDKRMQNGVSVFLTDYPNQLAEALIR